MPNIKSAKKRVTVSKTRAARNKSRNSALKTAMKKANFFHFPAARKKIFSHLRRSY